MNYEPFEAECLYLYIIVHHDFLFIIVLTSYAITNAVNFGTDSDYIDVLWYTPAHTHPLLHLSHRSLYRLLIATHHPVFTGVKIATTGHNG